MATRKPISSRSKLKRTPLQASAPKPYATKDGRHPAWGALKDITHLVPGVDLTEPAFPDWEKVWLEANAWWLDDPKLNPKG
jgi:hypothetical protein